MIQMKTSGEAVINTENVLDLYSLLNLWKKKNKKISSRYHIAKVKFCKMSTNKKALFFQINFNEKGILLKFCLQHTSEIIKLR